MTISGRERVWLVGGALSAFMLVLIGYFFVISPQRASTANLNEQVASARDQNLLNRNRLKILATQNKNMKKYTDELAQMSLALPNTTGLPDFLRTLQAIGNETLADVTSLTVGPPTDVTAIGNGAAAAAPGAGSARPATTQGEPDFTLYALSITAQVAGSNAQLDQFLEQLQSVQPRAVLITDITTGTGPGSATVAAHAGKVTTLQVTMQAFVAPTSVTEAADLAKGGTK